MGGCAIDRDMAIGIGTDMDMARAGWLGMIYNERMERKTRLTD